MAVGRGQVARVLHALWLGEYRVALAFSDGVRGVVDLAGVVEAGGVFEPLRDPEQFARFSVDRTLRWEALDVDLAPERLHELAQDWATAARVAAAGARA